MENEISNTEAEETSSQPKIEVLKKEMPLTNFFNHLSDQISRRVTAAEILIFAAAFATLPLVDFIAKAFGSLGAASQALYAIVPAAAFGLAYWFSRDEVRPISLFLHSLAAISLIMAVVALIPMIPGVTQTITVPGSIAIGMPILAIIFILISAKVPNTGASYIFAAIAAIIIFFLSLAQLFSIPCNNAMITGAEYAGAICSATPYIQNTLIPIAILALGWLAFGKSK